MKDLISIDDLSIQDINKIHKEAEKFFENPHSNSSTFKEKILVNLFFENSTRTRTSFEMAAKRLGIKVINFDGATSSIKKGESIIDTAKTINAMRPDFVVIRHNSSGIIDILKKHFDAALINAGDGTNEHPTQALLDSFIIKQHKHKISGLKIAICGDTLHSRVARSNIKLLSKLGAKINVITLPTLMPKDYQNWLEKNWQIAVFDNLEEGIEDVDVIMMLRIQQERMAGCYLPSFVEYHKNFGLTHERLKLAPNAIVMHPGPFNRDVEISSALADDEKVSVILHQVEAGVAVRQAILKTLI